MVSPVDSPWGSMGCYVRLLGHFVGWPLSQWSGGVHGLVAMPKSRGSAEGCSKGVPMAGPSCGSVAMGLGTHASRASRLPIPIVGINGASGATMVL